MGRPTAIVREARRLAADMAKKYLEDWLKPALDAYIAAGTGLQVGSKKRKLDLTTCRHYVERFVPPAQKVITVDVQNNVESFFERIQREQEEGRTQITDQRSDPPESEPQTAPPDPPSEDPPPEDPPPRPPMSIFQRDKLH